MIKIFNSEFVYGRITPEGISRVHQSIHWEQGNDPVMLDSVTLNGRTFFNVQLLSIRTDSKTNISKMWVAADQGIVAFERIRPKAGLWVKQ